MKYYQGRLMWSVLWLVIGLLWFLQGIFQFQMAYYEFALGYIFFTLLSLLNANIYRNKYLGMGEGKLVVNSSCIIRTVIMLENITLAEQTEKQLRLTYNEGPRSKNQKIKLSVLKDLDREDFLRDLYSVLSSKTKYVLLN